ncbi:MAG: SH3 domain-containing protein [Polyangiaceae bacterium]
MSRALRQSALHLVLAGVCLAALSWMRPAHAEEKVDAFARVVVEETTLRSGPGVSHRVIYVAHRGETFIVESRKGTGFWLKVVMPDGRSGWVLGETVQPIAVAANAVDRPSTPGFCAPPPLAEAHGGLAIMGGVFDEPSRGVSNGYLELRPAFVLAPTIGFEPYAGMALTQNGNELLYGGAVSLHFAPDWAIEPYATLGLGGLSTFPNVDSFVMKRETVWAARAGAGLLLALRMRILVRLEASNLTLFTEDSYRNAQIYQGGLGVYF